MNTKGDYLNSLLGFAIFYLLFSLVDLLGTSIKLEGFYVFLITILLSDLFLFFALYFFVFKNRDINEKVDSYIQNISRYLLSGVVAGLILGGVGLLSIFVKGNGILSLFSFEYLKGNVLPDAIIGKIVFVVVFVFLIPVIEEYYFRGFMYDTFNKEFGFLTAAIIGAVCSSIYLSGIISFLYLFISGITYSLLKEKTKGIAAGIIAHILGNFIIIFAIIIKGGS